jgi:O-antigen biosynthesis protein
MTYVWQELLNVGEGDFSPGYHDNPRLDLVQMFGHAPRRALEVGCAGGATGKAIKAQYPNCYVIGIELNKAAAEFARGHMDQVIIGSFDSIEMAQHNIAPESIDTVVLADVLEHMYNPWAALVKLKPYLTPDAQVLASIPNARNLTLIDSLANGYWGYEARGLLDITHIRFFTHREMIKLFNETGYQIQVVNGSPDPRLTHLVMPSDAAGPIHLNTEKLTIKNVGETELMELRTLQFLVRATPIQNPV